MGYREDIARINAGIDRMADSMQRETSLEVFRQVTQQTPVDTGRARSNWFMNVGSPATGTTEDTGGANVAAAESTAQAIKATDTVHVTNNLPYIEPLNNGTSTQAPANYVQSAVQGAVAKVEQIAARGLK